MSGIPGVPLPEEADRGYTTDYLTPCPHQWQPIEDVLDKIKRDGVRILLTGGTTGVQRRHPLTYAVTGSWREYDDDEFTWRTDGGRLINPTHWIPLPELPEATE